MDIVQILAGLGIGGLLSEGTRFFLRRKQAKEETRKSHSDWIKTEEDIYQGRISFLKRELEEKEAIIAKYKERHPENGKELQEWLESEEQHYAERVRLTQENRDLKEEIIFLKIEIRALQKK